MPYPNARDDVRELSRICREQADALVRIAVHVESGNATAHEISTRLGGIEDSLRGVDVYFTAQNHAAAAAAADYIRTQGRFRAAISAWVVWLTPARLIILFGLLQPFLLALGLGCAGWAQALFDAPAQPAPEGASNAPL